MKEFNRNSVKGKGCEEKHAYPMYKKRRKLFIQIIGKFVGICQKS